MHWYARRPHSASTGSTCPLRTWKQRDRAWGVLLDRAFTALGERLVRRGVVADVFVVGGAAMALAYDATRVTRDVDSLFVPHGVVLEEARNVAQDLELPGMVAQRAG